MKKIKIPEIQRQHINLMNQFHNRLNKRDEERYVMSDGIYDQVKYFDNKYRIAWMLKEAYDEDGGGFNYLNALLGGSNLYNNFNGGHRATWYPIAYTTYSILNNFK